jgi:Right handed beta helix region
MQRLSYRSTGFLLALLMSGCIVLGYREASGATLEAGFGKTYATPSAAIAAAHDGDTVSIAPGKYFDCAIVRANHLTIEGEGKPEDTVLTDKVCAGKGLLVIDGNDATVRNLTLARARDPDDNGAGIRAEGINLTVDRVRFINDQDGLLGGRGTVLVRRSEFARNGVCTQYCAHGIYVGEAELLRVESSRFTATRQGHHIKSRALRTEIVNCDITDGPDGTASYHIEIPNGGALVVRNNRLVKGPKAENHGGAIVIGSEEITHPTSEITISGNTFRNDGNYETYFVVNHTATDAMLESNKVSGSAKPLRGDGQVR